MIPSDLSQSPNTNLYPISPLSNSQSSPSSASNEEVSQQELESWKSDQINRYELDKIEVAAMAMSYYKKEIDRISTLMKAKEEQLESEITIYSSISMGMFFSNQIPGIEPLLKELENLNASNRAPSIKTKILNTPFEMMGLLLPVDALSFSIAFFQSELSREQIILFS